MPVVAQSLSQRRVAPRLVALVAGIIVAGVIGAFIAVGGGAIMLLVVVGVGWLLAAVWGRPRVAFVVWLLSIAMVPEWVGVNSLIAVPVYCLVAFAVLAASVAKSRARFTSFDAYFAAFLCLALLASLYSGTNKALWAEMAIRWGLPFFAGRIIVGATGVRFAANAIAAVLGIVGALACVELLLVWHPFVTWDFSSNPQAFQAWHSIQVRGGRDRSEWAFGHSIALGGSLALGIPFVAISTYQRLVKFVLLAAIMAGILATDSRAALLSAVLSGVLCLSYFLRGSFVRAFGLIFTSMAVLFTLSPYGALLQTWARGQSDEERVSARYRDQLYAQYFDGIAWFGRSNAVDSRSIPSIDSAILRTGLEFGWVIVVLALIPLVLSVIRLVAGRATIAEVAIVGQIPLFLTVALITQYQSVVFLAVSIAVSELLNNRQNEVPREPALSESPIEVSALEGGAREKVG